MIPWPELSIKALLARAILAPLTRAILAGENIYLDTDKYLGGGYTSFGLIFFKSFSFDNTDRCYTMYRGYIYALKSE